MDVAVVEILTCIDNRLLSILCLKQVAKLKQACLKCGVGNSLDHFSVNHGEQVLLTAVHTGIEKIKLSLSRKMRTEEQIATHLQSYRSEEHTSELQSPDH